MTALNLDSLNIKPLNTVAEVAKIFRVDEDTVRRWIREGDLDAIKILGRRIYRITDRTVYKALGTQPSSTVL